MHAIVIVTSRYACVRACMRACVRACVLVCLRACVCVARSHVRTHRHTHAHMHARTHAGVYVCVPHTFAVCCLHQCYHLILRCKTVVRSRCHSLFQNQNLRQIRFYLTWWYGTHSEDTANPRIGGSMQTRFFGGRERDIDIPWLQKDFKSLVAQSKG